MVGALGITSKKLKDWLGKLELKSSAELLQKAVLLGLQKLLGKSEKPKVVRETCSLGE